jgi:hypothetical protein
MSRRKGVLVGLLLAKIICCGGLCCFEDELHDTPSFFLLAAEPLPGLRRTCSSFGLHGLLGPLHFVVVSRLESKNGVAQ